MLSLKIKYKSMLHFKVIFKSMKRRDNTCHVDLQAWMSWDFQGYFPEILLSNFTEHDIDLLHFAYHYNVTFCFEFLFPIISNP